MATIASLSVRIGAQIQEFTNSMNQVMKDANKAASEVEKQFRAINRAGARFAEIGTSLSVGITAPLILLGGVAVNAAAKLESLEMGLDAVTGSTEETAKQMTRLKEVAKLPGLGLEEAVRASINLQAVGVNAELAERYIKGFGNALAIVGKGRNELQGVVTQLVQMSSKTKVVANDLKPIMEQVPQVASIVKKAFGTIDTEALQKMGVSTQQFLDTVLNSLEGLPKATGGIANGFENMKDSVTQSLAQIGDVIKPVIVPALAQLDALAKQVGELAAYFRTLPAPVQAGIGALVGMVAAIGPVLFGVGKMMTLGPAIAKGIASIASVVGLSSTAFLGWAAVIAVAVAALVALGVWVYQHWGSITAVLSQAWEGVKEMWTATWDKIKSVLTSVWGGIVAVAKVVFWPQIAFFNFLMEHIAPILIGAWDTIATFVTDIWHWISDTASSIWNGIKTTFNKFVQWLKDTIPGAKKLLTLDVAWESGKDAPKPPAPPKSNGSGGGGFKGGITDDLKNKIKELKTYTEDLAVATNKAFAAWLNPNATQTAQKLVELEAKLAELREAGVPVSQELHDKLVQEVKTEGFYKSLLENRKKLYEDLKKKQEELIETHIKELDIVQRTYDLERQRDAERASIVSDVSDQTSAKQREVEAQLLKERQQRELDAVDAISAHTTKKQIEVLKMRRDLQIKHLREEEQLQIDAINRERSAKISALEATLAFADDETRRRVQAQIQFINDAYDAQIAGVKKVNDAAAEGVGSQTQMKIQQTIDKSKELGKEVSTIITNMNQSIAQSIMEWKGFGDVAISTLKSIGQAILANIINTMTEAIKEGTSLTGMFAKMGKNLSGIFKAGEAAKTSADVATTGMKGAANAAQTVTKVAAGSVTAIVGAVGSIGTMISGFISNVQQAHTNKLLGRIEESTRKCANQLIYGIQPSLNEYLPGLLQLTALRTYGLPVFNADDREFYVHGVAGGLGGGGGLNVTVTGGVWSTPQTVTDFAQMMFAEMRRLGLRL